MTMHFLKKMRKSLTVEITLISGWTLFKTSKNIYPFRCVGVCMRDLWVFYHLAAC